MSVPRIPVATYRLQFNQHLRFSDAKNLIPYLHELGITDLYASPLLQAKRGSLHGYDVADPSHLNPELGTDEEFDELVGELQKRGMGLLLDIVPNHMAASSENPWWMDLLEDGPRSSFASHFDVDWHPPSRLLENRVLLPILGKPYAQALEERELRLSYGRNGFFLTYFDFVLPIATRSYGRLLGYRQDRLERTLGSEAPAWLEFQGIQAAVAQIPPPGSAPAEAPGERRQHREAVKERLWSLYSRSPEVRRFVDGNVRLFNGRKGIASTFLLLDQLLSDQAYALAFWSTANQEINYRRFFTISDLVGLRVEDPMTFEAIHSVVLRLATKGMVTGFRVDHIDGLRDPVGYLRRLQERAHPEPSSRPKDFYIVVEKILSTGESLPSEWPVHGTTGYDFLNVVNGLYVDSANITALEDVYARFINERVQYSELAYRKKKQVMDSLLGVEMRTLGRYLSVLAAHDRYARELPRAELTRSLVETTACLEPYRTYIRGFEVRAQDRAAIDRALREAQRRNPTIDPACFRFLREVLLLQPGPHLLPEEREARLAFVMTWQQFTGPITAKGVEDSALYVYNRLVSLNEVGSSPAGTDLSIAGFNRFMQDRHQKWPFSMNATMTHDAKRAEDVRARINVLSEIPEQWDQRLNFWSEINACKCQRVKNVRAPERNEETLLYQTLLGSWPVAEPACTCYTHRIQDFMVKAVREAMVHTRWTIPNLEHEQALINFVQAILDQSADNEFLKDFKPFARKVAYHGTLNSLSQLVVKLGCPGVADFYQGTESWDLRLVDPDNRQPVNFERYKTALASLADARHSVPEMLTNWEEGRIKMYVTTRGLKFRKQHAALFLKGDFLPMQVEGAQRECVIAFARRYRGDWSLIVVPRLTTRLTDGDYRAMRVGGLGETRLILPKEAPRRWLNLLDDERVESGESGENTLLASKLLSNVPVAMLTNAIEKPAD
jgi:(1->4)-alpha-D-glucan 1-alpha-D-glucosylmutase